MEQTKKIATTKPLFMGLSFLSIGCLVGAFAGPLEPLEVWHQTEYNQFQQPYTKVFIRTATERQLPYGFDAGRAEKIAQIYEAALFQKMLLLAASIIGAGLALSIGQDTVEKSEIDAEVATIESQGQKELIVSRIRHKLAMASEAQKQLMREELRALVDLAGGDETLEASEINETDKFINANYLLMEGHDIDTAVTQTWGPKPGTEEHTRLKQQFQQWLEE
jgi:hypothetical protein